MTTKSAKPLLPQLLWAQTKDAIFLTVDLQDVSDLKVDLSEENLSFHAVAHGETYEFDLPLFETISKQESKYAAQRSVQFKLVKETKGRWKELSKIGKQHWIKVDWSRWIDTDDEDGSNMNFGGDFDMGGMNFGDMGGMGGMGGMGRMGGDMGDSDEEDDIPDLDGPVDGAPAEDNEDERETV